MRALFALILLLTALCNNEAMAVEIEKFLMPGELISGHEEYESECTRCHVRLRDTTQKQLCLDCHELVAEDVANKTGFHGKDRGAANQECKTCHADHRGRDAIIVALDQDNFDHRLTDFELIGQHTQTECVACHSTDSKYRETEQACFSCHSEDDAHDGKLGKKCAQCHTPNEWGKTGFDHDKTDFKLKFSHQQVPCEACHIKGKYKDTPKQCVDCHAIRDVHANRFGDKCQQCHQPEKWDQSTFDHDRDTDYPLRGGHLGQSCNACHAIGYNASKPDKGVRSCYSCHRDDDTHKGSNGKKCRDCHEVRGWHLTMFDHDTKTDFPLQGGHADLECAACHVAGAEDRKLETGCDSCHRQDDVHERALGENCAQCHNDEAWQTRVRFDHDLAAFPLIGQHTVLGCEACHASSVFTETESECIDCHRNDDIHKRSLGDECAQCHNPNAWLIWRFNHDDTEFRLRHTHTEIHCDSCHSKPLDNYVGADWRCIDCHRRDDVHEGKFGARCNKCHSEESFTSPEIKP
jgi:hypothetical protein